ncbi:MAG: protein kinase [Anaerolineae bacterium]|nr:protein kinase [Anaerolineae bacterium]
MLDKGHMLQNRYRIVSLLGQGGMGAVYRAWDTRLNIPVALKEMVPQPGLDAATLVELRSQFQQEATILARMTHAHLVRVTDFFEEASNAYLVMDFVEGRSLADRIEQEGALSEEDVLTWAGQLLSALDYCHDQGVLHRDIKPQNVIIRSDGQAVLVDFGLVKLWDSSAPQTRTVMRGMGTPEYAPPEQYETAAGHTDPTSDIYSVGATLYHALTGQSPPTATRRMADPSQFVPIQQTAPDVTPQTEAVVLKAMELVRSQRWQSAQEMAEALKGRASAAVPAVARPVARKRQATKVMADAQRIAPRAAPLAKPVAQPVAQPRKARRFPVWIWVLVALGALLACGAVFLVGGVLVQQSQRAAREAAASATASAKQTAVAQDQATRAAVEAAATATAQALVQATATAEARLYMPLREASGWPIILADDFSAEGNGWSLGDYDDTLVEGSRSIDGGIYRWKAEAFDDFVWWSIPDTDEVSDLYLAVDVRLVDGVSNAQYGLVFRRGESKDYYLLLVGDDGYYEFVKVSGGDWTTLVEWTETAAVRSGEVNRLEIVAQGSQFTFYINGEYVGEFSDDQLTSGKPALVVGLKEAGDTSVVEFDNFDLRAP